MNYQIVQYDNGVDIIDSYKTLFDITTIQHIYKKYKWSRSKISIYFEWMLHTICYRLGIMRSSSKDTFLEFDNSWFSNLFKSYNRLKQN